MTTYLITSGGTKVPIDEVRHVGNMSSGRFGADLAREALKAGHIVIFLYAKGSVRPDQIVLNLKDPFLVPSIGGILMDQDFRSAVTANLFMVEYDDFDDYAVKLKKWVLYAKTGPDVVMLCAAVSDYGMAKTAGKISSDKDEITFTMSRLPKLITKVKEWRPDTFLVGFKLLVDSTMEDRTIAAGKQMEAAKSDLVVVNDLRDIKNDKHILWVHSSPNAVEVIKQNLAKELIGHIDHERRMKKQR